MRQVRRVAVAGVLHQQPVGPERQYVDEPEAVDLRHPCVHQDRMPQTMRRGEGPPGRGISASRSGTRRRAARRARPAPPARRSMCRPPASAGPARHPRYRRPGSAPSAPVRRRSGQGVEPASARPAGNPGNAPHRPAIRGAAAAAATRAAPALRPRRRTTGAPVADRAALVEPCNPQVRPQRRYANCRERPRQAHAGKRDIESMHFTIGHVRIGRPHRVPHGRLPPVRGRSDAEPPQDVSRVDRMSTGLGVARFHARKRERNVPPAHSADVPPAHCCRADFRAEPRAAPCAFPAQSRRGASLRQDRPGPWHPIAGAGQLCPRATALAPQGRPGGQAGPVEGRASPPSP